MKLNLAHRVTPEYDPSNLSKILGLIEREINRLSDGFGIAVTKTASFSLAGNWTICNGSGTITVTLPNPVTYVGLPIHLKTIAAFTVVSASANVVPLVGGAATTAILPATAGRWATLVGNGANFVIVESN